MIGGCEPYPSVSQNCLASDCIDVHHTNIVSAVQGLCGIVDANHGWFAIEESLETGVDLFNSMLANIFSITSVDLLLSKKSTYPCVSLQLATDHP